MSSVKVDPVDPINAVDIAQIVLSSIASTFKMKNIFFISKDKVMYRNYIVDICCYY